MSDVDFMQDVESDSDAELISELNGDSGQSESPDHANIDSESETANEPALPERIKIKVNGRDVEVTRDELISNYNKGLAAQEKFEAAAALRKEAETERVAFQQHQAMLQQAIQQIQAQAQMWAQQEQPNWQDLLENNPHEYLRQRELWAQRAATLEQAQAAQAYLQQQHVAAQYDALNKHIQVESEKLLSDYFPEWKDKSVRERDEGELISYLQSKGYSDDDLMALNHSRAGNIQLAVYAMRYEKLLEKAKKARQATNPETAQPMPTVGGKSSANRDPTQMTDAEFKKWRQGIRNRR